MRKILVIDVNCIAFRMDENAGYIDARWEADVLAWGKE
jgi:hypothetical protein